MTISNRPEFLAIVSRLESMQAEKDAVAEDMREVYKEAKEKELNVKALRRIIRDKRKEPHKLREENDLYDMYAHAAGLLVEGQ